jgi:hypothetical protein
MIVFGLISAWHPVPECIDPVFAKTSSKRSFSIAKTGSTNSGTGLLAEQQAMDIIHFSSGDSQQLKKITLKKSLRVLSSIIEILL